MYYSSNSILNFDTDKLLEESLLYKWLVYGLVRAS